MYLRDNLLILISIFSSLLKTDLSKRNTYFLLTNLLNEHNKDITLN